MDSDVQDYGVAQPASPDGRNLKYIKRLGMNHSPCLHSSPSLFPFCSPSISKFDLMSWQIETNPCMVQFFKITFPDI